MCVCIYVCMVMKISTYTSTQRNLDGDLTVIFEIILFAIILVHFP